MSFRRGGAHKRRDAIEAEVIAALRAHGVAVWQLHGRGLPDLLCVFRGRCYVMEVKSARGTLTPAQRTVPWPIVRSLDDAVAVLGLSTPEAA